MTTVEEPAAPAAEERPIGFGRMKRKEDPRFVRGKGRYVDDVKLPGMLHGAVLRSPSRTPGSCPSTPPPPRRTRR